MRRLSGAALLAASAALLFAAAETRAGQKIPIGPEYRGPRCVISVGDFSVEIEGAPEVIGDGLREMLETALFESNYFLVAKRSDMAGITAEQLLSDSFLSDPDAIIEQGKMRPAEVLVYGAVTSLEGGGMGIRVKLPNAPLKVGGTYHEATMTVQLQAVDSATGRLLASPEIKGSALSTKGSVGGTIKGVDMPVELDAFRNTPLELAIRDCIYRAVIELVQALPDELFRYDGS